MVSGVRQEDSYIAIQYLNKTENYPVDKLCTKLHICRSAYYKWLKREPSKNQQINEQLMEWIKELYEEQNGILGYRQMTITVNSGSHTGDRRCHTVGSVLCGRHSAKPFLLVVPAFSQHCYKGP